MTWGTRGVDSLERAPPPLPRRVFELPANHTKRGDGPLRGSVAHAHSPPSKLVWRSLRNPWLWLCLPPGFSVLKLGTSRRHKLPRCDPTPPSLATLGAPSQPRPNGTVETEGRTPVSRFSARLCPSPQPFPLLDLSRVQISPPNTMGGAALAALAKG